MNEKPDLLERFKQKEPGAVYSFDLEISGQWRSSHCLFSDSEQCFKKALEFSGEYTTRILLLKRWIDCEGKDISVLCQSDGEILSVDAWGIE